MAILKMINAKSNSIPAIVAAVLGGLFALTQGASAVQDALDSRYTKREDSSRLEAQYTAILQRLDRMEAKIDKSQAGQ